MPAADIELRSLKHVAIFAGLSDGALTRLDGQSRWRRYPANSEVIAIGDKGADVYFLTAGLARVLIQTGRGRDIAFRTIRPGDVFGELAAIGDTPRSASVIALEPSLIGSMASMHFQNALADEPELSKALLARLTSEIYRLTERVLEFSTLAVANRIQAELLRLAGARMETGGQVAIEPMPKHAMIAGRVSTHREAVAKELSRLARLGIVERTGNKLVILDLARLAQMVQDALES